MNQPTTPAWQGAVQVARARLQTIDEALAKLEALMPDSEPPPPVSSGQSSSDTYNQSGTTSSHETNQAPIANNVNPDEPTPVPALSSQALETFLETAYQKHYMPKGV